MLITPEDLSNFLGQDLSADPEFSQAHVACLFASSAVESHCKRVFEFTEDDVREFFWQPRIVLPDPPIVLITNVLLDGQETTYERDSLGALWFSERGTRIEVTYSHGFVEIPEVVKMVACRLASRLFKNPLGRTSYSAEGMDFSSPSDTSPRILTGDEIVALRPFRLHRTA